MSRIKIEHFSERAHGEIGVPQSIVKHAQQKIAFRANREHAAGTGCKPVARLPVSGVSELAGELQRREFGMRVEDCVCQYDPVRWELSVWAEEATRAERNSRALPRFSGGLNFRMAPDRAC